MKHKFLKPLGFACLSLVLTNVSIAQGVYKAPVSASVQGSDSLKIVFELNAKLISEKNQKNISDFIHRRQKLKNDHFLVVVWADRNIPDHGSLSIAQQNLAAARAKEISRIIRAAGAMEILSVEMTKQPNWVEKVLETKSADVKIQGFQENSAQSPHEDIGTRVNGLGGPSRGLIISFSDKTWHDKSFSQSLKDP
ncbi:MAG: hypothetical protein H7318_06330 [Oligoflexus sp.]|nr:hypothetical protein [Oligoflexus sp.]